MLNELAPAARASRGKEDAGHYYQYNEQSGKWEPLYKDGGTFTLREARKLKAAGAIVVPSVTGVFGVLHKEQLINWKIEQALKVAYDLKPSSPLSLEEYTDTIISKASGASMGAADLGTKIHAAIELSLSGQEYDAEMDVYVRPVLEQSYKLALVPEASEVCVGSKKLGVAGRCDLLCKGMTVVDFKSRKTKPNRKAPSYETDVAQLAFYGEAYWGDAFLQEGRGFIFVISTTEPGLVTPVEYGPKELIEAHEAFAGMVSVWRFIKKFDSRY